MADFVINDVHLMPIDMFGIIYIRKTQQYMNQAIYASVIIARECVFLLANVIQIAGSKG